MVHQSDRGTGLNWRKSSASQSGDECVEVAARGPEVFIRDSHDHAGGMLTLGSAQWRAFLSGLRDGNPGNR